MFRKARPFAGAALSLASLLLVLGLAGCGGGRPVPKPSPPAGAPPVQRQAAVGWAAGYLIHGRKPPQTSTPVILATGDGGRTWTAQNPGAGLTDAQIEKVDFVNARDGWILGVNERSDSSIILATTDGGTNWRQQYADPYRITGDILNAVSFVNPRDGWVAGVNQNTNSPVILATTDGGSNWTPQHALRKVAWGLSSVFFANPRDGWAVGGGILATTDGGRTWTVQNIPAGISIAGLAGVSFAGAENGWVVGARTAGPYQNGMRFTPLILATSDGGQTWSVQTLPSAADSSSFSFLQGVDFVNSRDGWAVAGGVLATTDRGRNWTLQTTTSGNLLRSVHFVNPKDGWAVGDRGVFLATTDGGTTWNQVQGLPSQAQSAYFSSVSFPRGQ